MAGRPVDCAEHAAQNAGRDRRQRIDGQRRTARRPVHAIADAENAVVLSAAEQDADERDFRQHRVDRIRRHKRAADVDLVVVEVDHALGGQAHARVVDDAILDRELPRGALEGSRHLVKAHAGWIDDRCAVLRDARSPGADQLAERRFVAQDEIIECRLAGAQVALRTQKQIEIAALETRIEIGEAEKRAGVGRHEPRFPARARRHHRAVADPPA